MRTAPSLERDPLFPQSSSSSSSSSSSKNNMKVDIPSGNEAAEKTMEQQQAPESAFSNLQASKKNSLRSLILVAVLAVTVAIVFVVALVPDWTKNSTDPNETVSQSYSTLQSPSTATKTNTTTKCKKTTYFESDQGPFHIKIPLLSPKVTLPYSSREEAKHDLEQLAKFEVNRAINQEHHASKVEGFNPQIPEMAMESNVADGTGVSTEIDSAFGGVNDFGTYQQEAGVVRSDFVKSNGKHVFAALEDKILVWSVKGELLKTVVMTPINVTYEDSVYWPVPVVPVKEPFEIYEEAENSTKNDNDEEAENSTKNDNDEEAEDFAAKNDNVDAEADSRSSVVWWNPKPYIQALLLDSQGTRLTAIVGGYGVEYAGDVDVIPVIQDYKATRMIVYDIADNGSLVEVSKKDINGYHVDSYSVGDVVHVVTKTGLRTWDYIIQPLQRWMPEYDGMSDEEYEAAAILTAEKVIPAFVDELLDLYTLDGEVVLTRLAVFASSFSTDDSMTKHIFDGGIANSITEIYSLDVREADASSDLSVSSSATLQPGYWGYVYATTDWMWVADQSWRWVEDKGTYIQDTVLLGFRLLDASSSFSAVGTVPGSLLSQFSVDFYRDPETNEEYIRAATTLNFGWRMWWGLPEIADFVNEEDSTSRTKNQVIILKVPSLHDGNQAGMELEQLGSVELGKKDETITAVRFFDNLSYVVTFERTDPFYVLDLSDPQKPKVLGELEIPGFSEFMHPIKDDNSVLVSIGQDADEQGVSLGFQISVFDSTDPTKPVLMDRLVIENDSHQWSGSTASWDERAFRYVKVGDLGRLIVPVSIYAGVDEGGKQLGQNFEGFMVFGVDLSRNENIITKEMEIDHTGMVWQFVPTENSKGCYCFSVLPERSMVFNGDLMTMKNQRVASTNLVSGMSMWNITLDTDEMCCGRG